MKVPSPQDRPDLYDFGDVPEDRNLSDEYVEAVTPEHVKKLIAERKAKKAGASDKADID